MPTVTAKDINDVIENKYSKLTDKEKRKRFYVCTKKRKRVLQMLQRH